MIYQLPNGKVIYLTTEEFLELSDLSFHQLINSGYGEDAPSFHKPAKYKDIKDSGLEIPDIDEDDLTVDWENLDT
jgi:hypothetical protein